MTNLINPSAKLHEHVPPNWYYLSLKVDPFQKLWHKTRYEQVKSVIDVVKGGEVLDVGSADGMFSKLIFDTTKASKLIGIEVLDKSVVWANKHWKNVRGMNFRIGDAQNLEFGSNMFDAVFCMEVLEHIYDPERVLNEFKRVMKRGGYGIFLVPTDDLLFRVVWFLWLHFYPRGWVWKDTHIQTFRRNGLYKMCKKVGFKIEVNKKFNLGMLHLVKVRKI